MLAAFPAAEFYCPPEEVIRIEAAREQRGHFNLIHHESGFKADIYAAGHDRLHAWGLAHAIEADLGGAIVIFAPPKYVILRKLEFFREGSSSKHLRDIGRMLIGLGEEWDPTTLTRMIAEHGLTAEWEQARARTDRGFSFAASSEHGQNRQHKNTGVRHWRASAGF